ncbi:MAG: hypothetical protein H0U86_12400 [Chloroflexi bacterium]|nr:hypothetical protein [Chloroflexota bacterium]
MARLSCFTHGYPVSGEAFVIQLALGLLGGVAVLMVYALVLPAASCPWLG